VEELLRKLIEPPDCKKLVESGLEGRKAIVIYGFDYPELPMDPAIGAFRYLRPGGSGSALAQTRLLLPC
jgi:hypothetical protein